MNHQKGKCGSRLLFSCCLFSMPTWPKIVLYLSMYRNIGATQIISNINFIWHSFQCPSIISLPWKFLCKYWCFSLFLLSLSIHQSFLPFSILMVNLSICAYICIYVYCVCITCVHDLNINLSWLYLHLHLNLHLHMYTLRNSNSVSFHKWFECMTTCF